MGKWCLVRHGQTEWNTKVRVQGHSDIALSEAGQGQAQRVARRLASISFTAAYSSDLARATETAEAILLGRNVSLRAAPELRELSYGLWEGMSYLEVQAQYPQLYAQLLTGDLTFAPPGGESVHDIVRRVDPLISRLKAAHASDAENILVVGHGGSLRALLVGALGLPLGAFWRFQLAPASISILSLYSEGATLDLWNDTSHLASSDE